MVDARWPRRHLVSRRFLAVGVLLAVAPGLHGFERAAASPSALVHTNGLRLAVPEVWRATITRDGFQVEPASGNERRRFPLLISIELLARPPELAADRMRRLESGRRLLYVVSRDEEGGSGGIDYTLVAVESAGSRWIRYQQRRQSEYGEPRFELWEIAERVSFVRNEAPADR